MRRLLFRLLAAAPPATDHVPDAELLRRFVASNDSAAFELIVHRHANAVWAACRRLLRTETDAEDAFQATFLALIRKAKTIRTPCAGGWLHRVAVNASLKLRERAARNSAETNQLADVPAPAVEPLDAELAAAVHEELARLSERERLPLVLCDLEGLSHADAATALGWPVGTVSGRLSRARAKLRERLERRGLTPSAALLPALVAPPRLIPNVLHSPASPAVVSLTEGVLAMTTTATWKWAVVVLACAGLAGAGAVFGFGGGGQPTPPRDAPAPPVADTPAPPAKDKPADEDWIPKPGSDDGPIKIRNGTKAPPSAFPDLQLPELDPKDPKPREKYEEDFAKLCPRLTGKTDVTIEPTDDTLRKLLKARLHQGVQEVRQFREIIRIGSWSGQQYSQLTECLTDMQAAATELWGNRPKELVPWLEELVMVAKEQERFHYLRVINGSDPPQVLNAARRHRLRVEAELWKAKKAA